MSDLTPDRPDRAVASVLAGQQPAPNRVAVDLAEFRTGRIVVSFDEFDRAPAIGDMVVACDLRTHREAAAEVMGINEHDHAAALVIDWSTERQVSP